MKVNWYPAAATLAQLMAAPLGCWNDATSMPFTIVPAAAAVAWREVVDIATPERACPMPVPESGPDSSCVSSGECPSAGLAFDNDVPEAALVMPACLACAEPPADVTKYAARVPATSAADMVTAAARTLRSRLAQSI